MEPQKTPKRQSNLEKEKQSERHRNSILQTILKSCSHQDSMVLAQKQTHRSVEQNRKPRNGPLPYGQLILDKAGKNIHWKKTISSKSGVGKIGKPRGEE